MNTKRKVRADFDKNQSITVNVSGCTEEEKKMVQQAFFDVGITWGLANDDEPRELDKDFYTNTYLGGRVSNVLMWSNTDGVSGLANIVTPTEFFSMVYEEEPQGHPHAELMMQYAEDAKTHAEPWKLWEVRNWQQKPDESSWIDCKFMPEWDVYCEYRRKPKTHLVHGVEVPDLRINAEAGKFCFVVSPLCSGYYESHVFTERASGNDYQWAEQGLCYEHTEAGKQAAILHAKIMLGIA